MRYVRGAVGALAAVVAVLASTTASASATDSAVHYTALGDSYSSGTGTRDYDPPTGACMRSPQAYPELFARSHEVDRFTFAACAGATTDDVVDKQLGALDANTTLVTLTVGGNDIGFAGVIRRCVLGDDSTCDRAVDGGEAKLRDELPGKLDRAFAAIADKAPNARVVVLGYPRLNEAGPCGIPGYTEAKRARINEGSDELAHVIADHARSAGFDYADARDRFAGHGICGTDPWINGPTLPFSESFHPNTDGQAHGYLPVLDRAT